MLASAAAAGVATVVTITGVLVGVDSSPALAVCDSSGGACIDTTAERTASMSILPLAHRGDDSLTVSNDGAQGETQVGVVGYLTADDASDAKVIKADAGTAVSVSLDRGERRRIRLSHVPGTARAVILQTGSSFSRASWQRTRSACSAPAPSSSVSAAPSTSASGASTGVRCGTARVAFSAHHDPVTREQVAVALRAWATRSATAMPSTSAVSRLTDSVQPATIAAAIAPQPGALTVSWRLDPGAEKVDAVRVTRTGPNGAATGGTSVDRPASSGSWTLKGLASGRSYTVTVAPVVDDATGAPITMTATALARVAAPSDGDQKPEPSSSPSESASAAPSPTASASSTPPSSGGDSGTALPGANAYPGWTRVVGQDFDTDAATGSFASRYPGWAGYDGNTSGASGTTWNSGSTMSVSDSVLRMRNWVSNGKAQAGALTPIVPGSGSWYQQAQTYGKYVVRFKADSVKGFKVAWLLWPTSNNWSQGEIDFPEANLDGTVNWSAHNVTGNPADQTWGASSTRMGDGRWHTATTTWEPGKVTYQLDGQVLKTVTDARFLPTQPMRWALQNEMSTDGSRPAANADGSVYIDWVAQYRRG